MEYRFYIINRIRLTELLLLPLRFPLDGNQVNKMETVEATMVGSILRSETVFTYDRPSMEYTPDTVGERSGVISYDL